MRVLNVLPRKSVASTHMTYEKERSQTSLTLEYRVITFMVRNIIHISWSQGMSYIDFWDIQERQLDTNFTALKNN